MLLFLTACAIPAHHNYTWFTVMDTKTVLVRVYSPDTYEVDGFLLDSDGLDQHVSNLKRTRIINKMLIEPKASASLFDQAVALKIGERYDLKTFWAGLFLVKESSSSQLLKKN